MSNSAKVIALPEDLQAFAEEQVRGGHATSVDDVVRDALEEKRLSALRAELDKGVAELEAGDTVRGTPDELIGAMRDGLSFDAIRKRAKR